MADELLGNNAVTCIIRNDYRRQIYWTRKREVHFQGLMKFDGAGVPAKVWLDGHIKPETFHYCKTKKFHLRLIFTISATESSK